MRNWPHPDDKPISRIEMAVVGVLVVISTGLIIWGLITRIWSWF